MGEHESDHGVADVRLVADVPAVEDALHHVRAPVAVGQLHALELAGVREAVDSPALGCGVVTRIAAIGEPPTIRHVAGSVVVPAVVGLGHGLVLSVGKGRHCRVVPSHHPAMMIVVCSARLVLSYEEVHRDTHIIIDDNHSFLFHP